MCGFCGIFRNCCRRERCRPFPCFVPVRMCVYPNPEFDQKNRCCCCCWEQERTCGCANNWGNGCRREQDNKCGCRDNWVHDNGCAKRDNWRHEKDCDW